MKIYTIGVYNSTEQEFFNKLVDNNIDTFCDIRQRRGVRGSGLLVKIVDKIGAIFVYRSKIVDKCGCLPAFFI